MIMAVTQIALAEEDEEESEGDEEVVVPLVHVRLVTSLRLPPYQSV